MHWGVRDMERRNFLKSAAWATALVSLEPPLSAAGVAAASAGGKGMVLYVDPVDGADSQPGTGAAPLRSLAAAVERVNRSSGTAPVTILLKEGIHAIDRTVHIAPRAGRFTAAARLTIRAAVLPGEPGWDFGKMPTLIHTLPLKDEWNGRKDPLGGAADGILVGTSHVTIAGLRILGMPVVEAPKPGMIRRLYSISRLDRSLDDLEIRQCLFIGDAFVAPSHVAIIALGNGLKVDHCVFRGLKIAAVYWQGGSSGHAMRHCVCDSLYGSSVWTSGIQSDFVYANNLVTGCNYVWTYQSAASAAADGAVKAATPAPMIEYTVRDCYFAGNRQLTGSGTGARLEYKDIDSGFLRLQNTPVVEMPVKLGTVASEHDYLHALPGSPAAAAGAGLF
jgi:hypothetical protein